MIDIERREKYTHTGTIAESGAISNHVITARWHHPRQSYVLAIWPPRRRRWRRSRAHSGRRLLWPWRAHGRCSPTTPRRSPPLREQARRRWQPQAWWTRSQLLRQPPPCLLLDSRGGTRVGFGHVGWALARPTHACPHPARPAPPAPPPALPPVPPLASAAPRLASRLVRASGLASLLPLLAQSSRRSPPRKVEALIDARAAHPECAVEYDSRARVRAVPASPPGATHR